MCAIIDANVATEVFGSERTEAGKKFLDWIDKGSGRLICGGKLQKELERIGDFEKWAKDALNYGKMKNINDGEVKRRTEQIQKESKLSSNDPHILALAQVSRARLLYSNDKKLHEDFKNRDLISPAGFIYSTLMKKKDRQKLLDKKGLCPSAKSMQQP